MVIFFTQENIFKKYQNPKKGRKISHKKRQTKALDSILCNEREEEDKDKEEDKREEKTTLTFRR